MHPEITTDTPVHITAAELTTAKRMADRLHKSYPGHLWAVSVEGAQGVATIRNLSLAGNWGFYVRLKDDWSSSNFDHVVKMLGGELLERYRVARAKADPEIMAHLPVNFAGQHMADRG